MSCPDDGGVISASEPADCSSPLPLPTMPSGLRRSSTSSADLQARSGAGARRAPMGDIPGLSVRHSCAKSLCFGGVRCGVLWHETAGQGVSGAAELSLVLRSGRRGREFKSPHPTQVKARFRARSRAFFVSYDSKVQLSAMSRVVRRVWDQACSWRAWKVDRQNGCPAGSA